MEVVLEKFDKEKDLSKQRALFLECFPENIGTPVLSEDHYLWKFHSISKPAGSYEYIARLEDDLIGYYAAIPYPYMVQGKKVSVAMVCDVMTGIKARGKGVFTKLGAYSLNEFKNEGLAFSTGYPIRPEVIPGHKKVGWQFPFQIPMYGKFLKFNAFLKVRKKSIFVIPANCVICTYTFFAGLFLCKNKKGFEVENYTSKQLSEIEGIDFFFEKWIGQQKNGLLKSVSFLNWRLGAPGKEYNILILRNGKEIVGYSVMRPVMKENVQCLGVLDFSMLSEYRKYSSILLNKISDVARMHKAELILMMMMKEKSKEFSLRSNGFFKTPYPFSFIINRFDTSLDETELYNEKNWNLMWIDSDDL